MTHRGPALSCSHLSASSAPEGPDRGGYICPQCCGKLCELPADCATCGLTLMSAPHLARSYHHLFPLAPYTELENRPQPGQPAVHCAACRVRIDSQPLVSAGSNPSRATDFLWLSTEMPLIQGGYIYNSRGDGLL